MKRNLDDTELFKRTNCEHQEFFPQREPLTEEEVRLLLEHIFRFTREELVWRFRSDPSRELVEDVLQRDSYISTIWHKGRGEMVGLGEVTVTPDDEHELSFMWSQNFTKAGLAHFIRRGLVCWGLRRLVTTSREKLFADKVVGLVESTNTRAQRFLNEQGFFEQPDGDGFKYTKSLSEDGPISALHEHFLQEYT